MPPEAVALAQVRILFRVLLQHADLGADVEQAFASVIWAESLPECQRLGTEFNRRFLFVDNPTLLQALLSEYEWILVGSERGVEWADFKNAALSMSPLPLGRPNDRKGGADYAAAVGRAKLLGHERRDLGAMWMAAEAWVEVRHERVGSLMKFVEGQQYPEVDGEATDIETRYRNWRRRLKAIDDALKRRDLPVLMP